MTVLNIGIYGAGSIGLAMAAHLINLGHKVSLFSPRKKLPSGYHLIEATGVLDGIFKVHIVASPSDLAKISDLIVIAVPGFASKQACDDIADRLTSNHEIVFSAHLSFAALYLNQLLSKRNLKLPITAWNTTALTARRTGTLSVAIKTIRENIGYTSIGEKDQETLGSQYAEVFSVQHTAFDSMLDIVLSNLNPQLHLGMVMGNLTRIEKQEIWCQRSNVTSSVGRYIEALDKERIKVASSFKRDTNSIIDHYSTCDEKHSTVFEIFQTLASSRMVSGPKSLSSRYVEEDIPFGVHVISFLGKINKVNTPYHDAGIDLMNVFSGKDFRLSNDIIPLLELSSIDAAVKY